MLHISSEILKFENGKKKKMVGIPTWNLGLQVKILRSWLTLSTDIADITETILSPSIWVIQGLGYNPIIWDFYVFIYVAMLKKVYLFIYFQKSTGTKYSK